MSYNVFPTLVGRGWGIKKRPITSTLIEQADSGAEYRTSRYQYPLYEFDIEIPYLGAADYDNLIGFFNQQGGPFTPFYFNVDNDNSATNQAFGTGDGTTAAFQLTNTYGTYWNEPIGGVQGTPLIYRNDWQGNQLMYATPRTNLLTQSAVNLTNWAATNLTVTAAAGTAPDGSGNAATLVETVTAGVHAHSHSTATITAGGTYTASVMLKANGRQYVEVLVDNAAANGFFAIFDLTNGLIAKAATAYGTGTAINATITAMGSGYYRCSVTGIVDATDTSARVSIAMANASNAGPFPSYAGSTSAGVYAWGAQLEAAATLTSYIGTTTTAVTVTDYQLSASGLVTFNAAPLAGAALTWTGNYYYLVRFKDDHIETAQTMSNIFEASTITLRTFR